jgi:hypothetical protein
MKLDLEPIKLHDAEFLLGDFGLKIVGVMSMRNPHDSVTPYLKKVHQATLKAGLRRLDVNIRGLSFMNSSSIRSLVDWVDWIRSEPRDKQYVLAFLYDPEITWQMTTLSVVRSLDTEHVELFC